MTSLPLPLLLFWVSVLWVAYVYLGYPIALFLLGLIKRFRPAIIPDRPLPTVSVLISARNEERDIGWKVRQTLEWDYPTDRLEVLVASDASEDGTDAVLHEIHDPRFTFVRMETRSGKNAALRRLAQGAKGEILFFTDANSNIQAGCLRMMVSYFADPRVGAVTGIERTIGADDDAGLASGGGAYLKYESLINSLESRLGSVLVCDGSVFCTRRELFPALDPELANDLEQPLRIGAQGHKIVYEPRAFSLEKTTCSPRQEFERRRRICGQGALGMWRLRTSLHGLRLWQFASRKFLRWLTVVPLLGLLLASLSMTGARFFLGALLIQGFCYLLAGIGGLLVSGGKRANRMFSLPFYFVLVNCAALLGVIDACRGRRYGIWDVATLSRGGEPHTVEATHA